MSKKQEGWNIPTFLLLAHPWRRWDSNPHGELTPADFLTTMAFATSDGVCGLDFTLTVAVRLRSQPSSLYTFPITWAWLGVATATGSRGFPDFGRIHTGRFRPWCSSLSPPRKPISPRRRSCRPILSLLPFLSTRLTRPSNLDIIVALLEEKKTPNRRSKFPHMKMRQCVTG